MCIISYHSTQALALWRSSARLFPPLQRRRSKRHALEEASSDGGEGMPKTDGGMACRCSDDSVARGKGEVFCTIEHSGIIASVFFVQKLRNK